MTLFADRVKRVDKSARDAGMALPSVLLALPRSKRVAGQADVLESFKHRLETSGHRVDILSDEIPSGQDSGQSAVLGRLCYLKRLVRALPHYQILHLLYLPGVSVLTQILPAVFLGRFLGRRVILEYRSPVLLNRVAGRGLLFQKLWRMCHVVVVPSAFQRQLVNSLGGRAEWVPGMVACDKVEVRVIRTIQPRIIIDTELEREHNVISAVKAYQIVKQKYPRTELVIVGDGAQRNGLERFVEARSIPGVSFTGLLSAVERMRLYAESDLVVNCSTIDYLPESVSLAFACGLPVLTTPVSGGGETYRGRENIMLLTYNDHAGLADRIIELVEDPDLTEKLSRNGAATGRRLARSTDSGGWSRFYALLAGRAE